MLVLAAIERFKRPSSQQQRRYLKLMQDMKSEFSQLVGDKSILLMPTLPQVATKHSETLIRFYSFGAPCLFNMLEVPAVQCPIGVGRKGLPIGVTVVAGKTQDHLCLAAASALERKFGGWIPPCDVRLDGDP